MKENVNHPSHYNHGGKETIEIIKDFLMGDSLTGSEFKGFLKGNILKYLHRYEFKNGVEDLCKAQWYLNKLKELEEKNG